MAVNKKVKLKVYGGNLFNQDYKQERVVCAVANQKEVAELTKQSSYYVRGWWSITGNAEEIEKALANPHKLIWTGRL